MRAARGFGRARPPTPEEQELTEQISVLQKEVRELERQKDAILVPKRSMTHSRETAEKRIAQWTKEQNSQQGREEGENRYVYSPGVP